MEAAINLQRPTMSRRHPSGGNSALEKETPVPPAVIVEDRRIYSMVNDGQYSQTRTGRSPPDGQRSRLDAPADKVLTGVKSLNLDSRPQPRKCQVKNHRSCPLAKSEDQTYSQITLGSLDHGTERCQSLEEPDSDYSLPFDTIAKNVMADILQAGKQEAGVLDNNPADPLYDSIDEMAIGGVHRVRNESPKDKYTRAEHIYDEPEGIAKAAAGVAASDSVSMPTTSSTSLYDNPEEVKGQAWKMLGEAGEPSGHEYPYNPNADDYAVPKPPRRAFPPSSERECEGNGETAVSPYDNVNVKKNQSS